MTRRAADLVVFLGPSLSLHEARRLCRARFLPPARQGDVWRALALRPRAIALIDGVFEHVPSVWHHELLAALDAGVAVFGASSMGALRAAELDRFGMIGVGQIYRWFRDGELLDDAEVALLHADAEQGFRPLTVPLVNVRHAAACAVSEGVLTRKPAASLVTAAKGLFYQDRSWPAVIDRAARGWKEGARRRFRTWFARGVEDLKARDARECLEAAAAFVAQHPGPLPRAGDVVPPSSARRRRLREGGVADGGGWISSGEVLERLRSRNDAEALAARGVTRLVISGWARSLGLSAPRSLRDKVEARWLAALGARGSRASLWARLGLDAGEAERLIDDLALEELVLTQATRLVPDGPAWDEGLALEARLTGAWLEAARSLTGGPSRRKKPRHLSKAPGGSRGYPPQPR